MKRKPQPSAGAGISRRNFLKLSSAYPVAITAGETTQTQRGTPHSAGLEFGLPVSEGQKPLSVRGFLERLTYTRKEVDTYLDPAQPNWAKFDPELGYTLRPCVLRDGVDGARTTTRYGPAGERLRINGADQPCRINTYGDSFTMGQQVSDGETWQEYLAAHLGEPLRNFGVGGYGVYQAYRRLLRLEATAVSAEYLIFNIWGMDDHYRSIDAWRWLRFGEVYRRLPGHLNLFHCNPWVHVRLDLNTGSIVEKENPYSTPESLYELCDKEYVYEHFKNDLVVQLLVAQWKGSGVDLKELKVLADALKLKADFSTPAAIAQTAHRLRVRYALRASMQIVEKVQVFTHERNKKLLVLLSYDDGTVIDACQDFPRIDQEFIDFLKEKNVRFVDALAKHHEDFRQFRLTPSEYARHYYHGHYQPQGNHFFAFAIKDAVVDWLEPKPPAYHAGTETIPG